ncbi:Transposase_Tc1-like protein [Hexamita inflata]|uniref:Transposase_Tc1-like protein n=1 Tax=Hexamita inflata TaxID=28002 RepID=A0ABP1HDR5_9EUKA
MQSPNCLFHFKHFEVTGKLEASHADNSVRKFDQAEIFALLNIARAIDSKLDESQLKNTKPFVEFPCLQQRYLVSWPNSVQASMLQDKAKLTEKHKLESLNFARMNLKQPIEYWRTFQYTDEYRSKCYANRASRVLRTPKDEWNPKYFLEVQNMDCFRA